MLAAAKIARRRMKLEEHHLYSVRLEAQST
jgi:hypothetical protein